VSFRFDGWLYDPETRQLSRAERAVELTPKAFELLGILLRNRPRAMSKAELRDLLWPDTFVSETSLARLVNEIRKALADPARAPRFVRTAYGFGYAFCGTAGEQPITRPRPSSGTSECWLLRGTEEIELREGENVLGRGAQAAVRIRSSGVSRAHARILVSAGLAILEDLGSKNGTFHKGRRIEGRVSLADGDQIVVGPTLLTFCSGAGDGSTRTVGGA
jgi:DNA-binding winged helix-turn-helix (wHTH) protein